MSCVDCLMKFSACLSTVLFLCHHFFSFVSMSIFHTSPVQCFCSSVPYSTVRVTCSSPIDWRMCQAVSICIHCTCLFLFSVTQSWDDLISPKISKCTYVQLQLLFQTWIIQGHTIRVSWKTSRLPRAKNTWNNWQNPLRNLNLNLTTDKSAVYRYQLLSEEHKSFICFLCNLVKFID